MLQRHIQNPANYLKWSILQKQFTAEWRLLFLQKAPSKMLTGFRIRLPANHIISHSIFHLTPRLHTEVSTSQKMKFSIKDFFSECDQIRSFLRIWSHLLKKPLMENFIFCAV